MFIRSLTGTGPFGGSCQIHGPIPLTQSESEDLSNLPDDNGCDGIKSPIINNPAFSHQHCPTEIHRSCFCVRFIAEHTKLQEDSTKVNFVYQFGALILCIHIQRKTSEMLALFVLYCIQQRRVLYKYTKCHSARRSIFTVYIVLHCSLLSY